MYIIEIICRNYLAEYFRYINLIIAIIFGRVRSQTSFCTLLNFNNFSHNYIDLIYKH